MSIGLLMTLVGFVMAVTGRYGFDNNEIEKRKHNKHHMNYSCPFYLHYFSPSPFYRVM
jgi:hypothetical protein